MSGMPLTPEMVEAHLEEKVDRFLVDRIPTGVSDFDTIVKGGLPAGSLVLLLGDVGAGQREYVYTSASKIAIVSENPHLRKYYLGSSAENGLLPKRICYISFTRSKADILKEVAISFNPQYVEAMERLTTFKDFSGDYFKRTVVPDSWTHSVDDNPFGGHSGNLLEKLVTYLDDNANDSVVVVDSLTDLVESDEVSDDDLIATMKGLQRASKNWNGIVYLLLTQGIMEKKYQQMLMDAVDGVLNFQWRNYLNSSKRQRYMYVEKFLGLMPHLEAERIARFPTMLTCHQGLTILYMERII
jgi:KaiC/GvpD/RAD55 family RecA-like ATPase